MIFNRSKNSDETIMDETTRSKQESVYQDVVGTESNATMDRMEFNVGLQLLSIEASEDAVDEAYNNIASNSGMSCDEFQQACRALMLPKVERQAQQNGLGEPGVNTLPPLSKQAEETFPHIRRGMHGSQVGILHVKSAYEERHDVAPANPNGHTGRTDSFEAIDNTPRKLPDSGIYMRGTKITSADSTHSSRGSRNIANVLSVAAPHDTTHAFCTSTDWKKTRKFLVIFLVQVIILFLAALTLSLLEFSNEKQNLANNKLIRQEYQSALEALRNISSELEVAQFNSSTNLTAVAENIERFGNVVDSLSCSKAAGITNELPIPNWNYSGSLFFVMTLVSTVGYGTYTPQTDSGKLFVVCFSLFGVSYFGYLLSLCSERSLRLISYIAQKWHKLPPGYKLSPKRALEVLGILTICYMVLLTAPAVIIMETTVLNGVYFTFVTFLTIGFGDYVPQYNGPPDDNMAIGLFLVLFGSLVLLGMALLSAVIGGIQDLMAKSEILAGNMVIPVSTTSLNPTMVAFVGKMKDLQTRNNSSGIIKKASENFKKTRLNSKSSGNSLTRLTSLKAAANAVVQQENANL